MTLGALILLLALASGAAAAVIAAMEEFESGGVEGFWSNEIHR